MNIVTLIEELVNGLIAAEDIFFQNPKDFYSLEKSVKSTTEAFSAAFLGNVLTSMNEKIYEDRWRKTRYTAQRTDKRMLISSVGDITFESTYFRSKADGVHHYLLEEILGLDTRERFTEEAEVVLLTEAMKTSYSEATKVLPSRQEISKTTVMNKVHGIADEIWIPEREEKKVCKYLFIEADEDHVAEQHGRWYPPEDNSSFISKLAYVYEYKQENPKCKARKELVNTFYFGGVYSGTNGTEKFWNKVGEFIHKTYKQGIKEYTDRMMASASNQKPIQDLQTFVLGNWSAVMRTYHSKVITGCSAESHVSHVLSDRLSSRPMGWSKTGADRMSKLRCYEKNYGREKIIDLVKYSRQQRKLARTGTDSVEPIRVSLREIRADHYNQARSYIERIQATIPDGTVRKIAAIREQIRLI